jgi:hypothetical protein
MGMAALAGSLWSAAALGQTLIPATSAGLISFRVTLAGREGTWASTPLTTGMEMGISSDAVPTVWIRSIQIAPPILTCETSAGIGTVAVQFSNLVLQAAPTTIAMTTTSGPGVRSFQGSGITTSAQGTANYQVNGTGCQMLMLGSTPCSGPFNLSLVPASSSGQIEFGEITQTGAVRNFAMVFKGSYPFVNGASWGKLDVYAEISGSVQVGGSSCAADFDHSGGLAVQDIFSFLNAWFAAGPGADFNQTGGLTVQDIFDFLNAWFAGCP